MSNHFEKPAHAREDWTIDQGWSDYTADEHAVWDLLYKRQMDVLPGRAAPEFLEGLKALDLGKGGIPEFEAMSDELEALTGWRVEIVEVGEGTATRHFDSTAEIDFRGSRVEGNLEQGAGAGPVQDTTNRGFHLCLRAAGAEERDPLVRSR